MKSEQARLIESLQSKGYTTKQLAALTGRSERYITQARSSEIKTGKGGRVTSGKGQNLVPALKALNERGKLSPAQIPERRKTKAGKTAKVRGQRVTKISTKKGEVVGEKATLSPKAKATLRGRLEDAAKRGKRIRWNIAATLKKESDGKWVKGWVSGQLPSGWSAQTLLDKIDNPQPEDNWQAGDAAKALASIAVGQTDGAISSIRALRQLDIFTLE